MKYVYYDEPLETVYILDEPSLLCGVQIGGLKHLPPEVNELFLVSALLTNAGFTHKTGITISHQLPEIPSID